MLKRQQNQPNFRINVFVYHPATNELVTSYAIDQCIVGHETNFNATVKACYDCIEAAQSTDGLRYIGYVPLYESWRKQGNRVKEFTIE